MLSRTTTSILFLALRDKIKGNPSPALIISFSFEDLIFLLFGRLLLFLNILQRDLKDKVETFFLDQNELKSEA